MLLLCQALMSSVTFLLVCPWLSPFFYSVIKSPSIFQLAAYLANAAGPVPLVLELRITGVLLTVQIQGGTKKFYRSMDTAGDPVPVGQRDVPVNHFTG